ncbi:MAG TPA: protein phosphatase 2C domain-containing protein [Terriglobia bacterium]|nr:protein phosphatase 2C domain-containing protein [Terriglobia bacterium]
MVERPEESAAEAARVAVFAVSDTGRVRKNNEDAFAVFNLDTGENGLDPAVLNHVVGPQGTLLLLADGMGGQASGEVASSMCAATVSRRLYNNLHIVPHTSDVNFGLLLREAVEYANQLIFQKGQEEPAFRGMGCTLTMAVIRGRSLFVAQVGDSRAYLCRNGAMVQLTHDQTYQQYLAEMGIETPPGRGGGSNRNILLRAVGSRETLEGIEVNCTSLRRGDRILLCCDGLYNMVRIPDDATAVVNGGESLAAKCQALVDRANEAGGADNITVVLAEVDGPGLPPAEPSAEVETVAY